MWPGGWRPPTSGATCRRNERLRTKVQQVERAHLPPKSQPISGWEARWLALASPRRWCRWRASSYLSYPLPRLVVSYWQSRSSWPHWDMQVLNDLASVIECLEMHMLTNAAVGRHKIAGGHSELTETIGGSVYARCKLPIACPQPLFCGTECDIRADRPVASCSPSLVGPWARPRCCDWGGHLRTVPEAGARRQGRRIRPTRRSGLTTIYLSRPTVIAWPQRIAVWCYRPETCFWCRAATSQQASALRAPIALLKTSRSADAGLGIAD